MHPMFIVYVGIMLAITVFVVLLTIRATTDVDPRWNTMRYSLIAIGGISPFIAFASRGFRAPILFQSIASWVGYVAMGMWAYWMLLIGIRKLASMFAQRLPRKASADADSMVASRRMLLTRSSTLLAATSAIAAYGVAKARDIPAVKSVNVQLPRWPKDVKPLRLLQLSDIHVGPTIKRDYVEAVVKRANEQKPDLICITGDLVDGSVEQLWDDVAPLANLSCPLGVYFVTGNHEYYSGVQDWMAAIEKLGITVLHNNHKVLTWQGGNISLIGVPDHRGGRFFEDHVPNPRTAVDGLDLSLGYANILLAHQPRTIEHVDQDNVSVDLQLSGHTHGGQIAPFDQLVSLVQPYVAGLHSHRAQQIYISRGTGYWGPPMRVLAPSEITVLTLGAA